MTERMFQELVIRFLVILLDRTTSKPNDASCRIERTLLTDAALLLDKPRDFFRQKENDGG